MTKQRCANMNRITLKRSVDALAIACLALALTSASTGCLGRRIGSHLMQEYRSNEGSFSEAPALPKADFGRPKSELKGTGSDKRAREIEASLGVGG